MAENRYQKLIDHLSEQTKNGEMGVYLTKEEFERILEFPLPEDAFKNKRWWRSSFGSEQGMALLEAGYRVTNAQSFTENPHLVKKIALERRNPVVALFWDGKGALYKRLTAIALILGFLGVSVFSLITYFANKPPVLPPPSEPWDMQSFKPEEADNNYNLAVTYHEQGDFAKAAEYYIQSAKGFEDSFGLMSRDRAVALGRAGWMYHRLERYSQAIDLYSKAKAVFIQLSEAEVIAFFDKLLGMVYEEQGDKEAKGGKENAQDYYEKALACYNNAVKEYEKFMDMESLDMAMLYYDIGSIYSSLSQYKEALEWLDKALPIQEKELGEDHLDTASTYSKKASSLLILSMEGGKKFPSGYPETLELALKAYRTEYKTLDKNDSRLWVDCEILRIAYDYYGVSDIPFEQWLETQGLKVTDIP